MHGEAHFPFIDSSSISNLNNLSCVYSQTVALYLQHKYSCTFLCMNNCNNFVTCVGLTVTRVVYQ